MIWENIMFMAALKAQAPATYPIMTGLLSVMECDNQINAIIAQVRAHHGNTAGLNKTLAAYKELRKKTLEELGITDVKNNNPGG